MIPTMRTFPCHRIHYFALTIFVKLVQGSRVDQFKTTKKQSGTSQYQYQSRENVSTATELVAMYSATYLQQLSGKAVRLWLPLSLYQLNLCHAMKKWYVQVIDSYSFGGSAGQEILVCVSQFLFTVLVVGLRHVLRCVSQIICMHTLVVASGIPVAIIRVASHATTLV